MSEAHVYGAFLKAQKAFGHALKNKSNPHLKSSYADLQAVFDAITEGLHAAGFSIMQVPVNMDDRSVSIQTLFLHESGEKIDGGTLRVPLVKCDPQGLGSALSYGRRYSLLAACGVAQADDDGHQGTTKPNGQQPAILDRISGCKTVDELNDLYRSLSEKERAPHTAVFAERKQALKAAA